MMCRVWNLLNSRKVLLLLFETQTKPEEESMEPENKRTIEDVEKDEDEVGGETAKRLKEDDYDPEVDI